MIVSWYASAQYQKAQFAKIPPTIIEVPVEVIVQKRLSTGSFNEY